MTLSAPSFRRAEQPEHLEQLGEHNRHCLSFTQDLSEGDDWSDNLPSRHIQAYTDACMPQHRTSLFLPDDVLDALDALKTRDGIPQAESVRRALYGYLKAKGFKVGPTGPKGTTRKGDKR